MDTLVDLYQDSPDSAILDPEADEKAIVAKIDEFGQDYDLSELKINDKIILRQLVQAIISLEVLEKLFATLRNNVTDKNVLVIDRVATVMNKLRADISKMQDDLKLTRKTRLESVEENFAIWLDSTKKKAMSFYKEKHLYVFCSKCKRLLATVWLLYPGGKNVLSLECKNPECGEITTVTLSELYQTDGKNIKDLVVP